jgi:uncharacterized membrane protein YcgQ (UPF0703/DUF1980 family)
MAPDWTNQIPNYAICNFFYAFYVVYAVIFVLAVLQILYILSSVKKFDLNNGIMLASGFFTTALALVLTLFHYLVCDRALMHRAIKDVEGFSTPQSNRPTVASTTAQQTTATTQSRTQTTPPPANAPVTCPAGCVAAR